MLDAHQLPVPCRYSGRPSISSSSNQDQDTNRFDDIGVCHQGFAEEMSSIERQNKKFLFLKGQDGVTERFVDSGRLHIEDRDEKRILDIQEFGFISSYATPIHRTPVVNTCRPKSDQD